MRKTYQMNYPNHHRPLFLAHHSAYSLLTSRYCNDFASKATHDIPKYLSCRETHGFFVPCIQWLVQDAYVAIHSVCYTDHPILQVAHNYFSYKSSFSTVYKKLPEITIAIRG